MNRFNLYKRHLYILFSTTEIIQVAEGDGNGCSKPELELRCHCKFTAVLNIIVKRLDKVVIRIKNQP